MPEYDVPSRTVVTVDKEIELRAGEEAVTVNFPPVPDGKVLKVRVNVRGEMVDDES